MIESFRGEYSFLSNFTELEKPFTYKGVVYTTVEHFYQAMKVLDEDVRMQIANHPSKGLKSFVRSFPLRGDWDEVKEAIMMKALKYKFSEHNPTLLSKLIATGDIAIQEGNWWGDSYWDTV